MIINNSGIVLVNHFFLAREAGFYAAIAMVGRVIFSFSQAVVNSTFPLVAGTSSEERRDLRVIATSLGLVFGVGVAISVGLCIAPAELWSHLFGTDFRSQGDTTCLTCWRFTRLPRLFTLSPRSSSPSRCLTKSQIPAGCSWHSAAFSSRQFASSILHCERWCWFNSALMGFLFVFISVPFLINSLTDPKDILQPGSLSSLSLICRISEDAAIAEFLKSDFQGPAFRQYQNSLSEIVKSPNFGDPDENAKRRALLLHPPSVSLERDSPETEWYEAEITPDDLANVRMFPRAQWRKVANGRYSTLDIAEGMRTGQDRLDSAFVSKIRAIGRRFDAEDPELEHRSDDWSK